MNTNKYKRVYIVIIILVLLFGVPLNYTSSGGIAGNVERGITLGSIFSPLMAKLNYNYIIHSGAADMEYNMYSIIWWLLILEVVIITAIGFIFYQKAKKNKNG